MKIERISENQLKLTLTKEDLKEREITLEDLLSPFAHIQHIGIFQSACVAGLTAAGGIEHGFLQQNLPTALDFLARADYGIHLRLILIQII